MVQTKENIRQKQPIRNRRELESLSVLNVSRFRAGNYGCCNGGMLTPVAAAVFCFPKKENKMKKKKEISIEEMIVKLEEVEKQTKKLSRQIHDLRTYYGPFYLDNSYVVQASLREVLSFVDIQKQSLKSLLINK